MPSTGRPAPQALSVSWEQRLRELVLAGGAVLATGCVDATPEPPPNPMGSTPEVDATPAEAAPDAPADSTRDSAVDAARDAPADVASEPFEASPFCCNADPDPCCVYLNCGEPITPTCMQEMACQADGGSWNAYDLVDGAVTIVQGCSFPPDAGPSDGSPHDAKSDAPD